MAVFGGRRTGLVKGGSGFFTGAAMAVFAGGVDGLHGLHRLELQGLCGGCDGLQKGCVVEVKSELSHGCF